MILCYICTQNAATGEEEVWFIFQKVKYMYDAEEKKQFVPLPFPVDWSINRYMEWKGYAEEEDLKQAQAKYGCNK